MSGIVFVLFEENSVRRLAQAPEGMAAATAREKLKDAADEAVDMDGPDKGDCMLEVLIRDGWTEPTWEVYSLM